MDVVPHSNLHEKSLPNGAGEAFEMMYTTRYFMKTKRFASVKMPPDLSGGEPLTVRQ